MDLDSVITHTYGILPLTIRGLPKSKKKKIIKNFKIYFRYRRINFFWFRHDLSSSSDPVWRTQFDRRHRSCPKVPHWSSRDRRVRNRLYTPIVIVDGVSKSTLNLLNYRYFSNFVTNRVVSEYNLSWYTLVSKSL